MIKLTFCLHRLPHLSRDAFQTYWRETHAPLVASVADTLGIKRYVQSHARAHKVDAAIQASRGSPESYDGVAELWWESWEQFFAAGSNPGSEEANALLLEDERKFIDLTRSPLWFNEEHVVVG